MRRLFALALSIMAAFAVVAAVQLLVSGEVTMSAVFLALLVWPHLVDAAEALYNVMDELEWDEKIDWVAVALRLWAGLALLVSVLLLAAKY